VDGSEGAAPQEREPESAPAQGDGTKAERAQREQRRKRQQRRRRKHGRHR
jgi:hypothetical protein